MQKALLIKLIFIFSAIGLAAQTKNLSGTGTATVAQILPDGFKSDGCTHFPNGDYLDCCIQHDLAYFNGGTWIQRWRADGQLRKCVAAKKGWWHKPVSVMMWSGVRIGGVPFLRQPFSWGFGKTSAKNSSIMTQNEVKIQ